MVRPSIAVCTLTSPTFVVCPAQIGTLFALQNTRSVNSLEGSPTIPDNNSASVAFSSGGVIIWRSEFLLQDTAVKAISAKRTNKDLNVFMIGTD
jgi:hypothetical protein